MVMRITFSQDSLQIDQIVVLTNNKASRGDPER